MHENNLYIYIHSIFHIFVEHNECDTGVHTCANTAQCRNLQGGYECICLPGYSGDGYTCQRKRNYQFDIDSYSMGIFSYSMGINRNTF